MKKVISSFLIALGIMGFVASCSPANGLIDNISHLDEAGEEPEEFEDENDLVCDYNHPLRASEEEDTPSATKVIIHYHNDDMACLNRRFYTWTTGIDGFERKPNGDWTATDMSITMDFTIPKEDGGYPEYLNMPSFFFIIKVAGTWAGQSEDIELPYSKYAPDENGLLEVWTIPGEGSSVEIYRSEAETKFPKVKTAKFTDWKTIHCEADEKPMYYKLYAFDKNYLKGSPDEQSANKQFHLFKSGNPTSMSFDIKFTFTAKINVQYVIETEYASNPGRVQKIIVSCENLFETPRFEEFYTYDNSTAQDLGCTYSKEGARERATFKVWSPISAFVTLNIFNVGEPKTLGGSDACRKYEMGYVKGGIWQLTLTSDDVPLAGKYYTYSLTHSSGSVEAMDPYAKACGLNGVRGFIYDKNSSDANPEGWSNVPEKWDGVSGYDIASSQDLSIYEVHVRDLTMDDTWVSNKGNARGTYNAFVESGTTYSESGKTVTTGYDHINGLGVKAVQLMPVFDSDNDERPEKMKFNWGYNPLNYNCVEGAYSSDPSNPLTRIKEYKNLIMQMSKTDAHTRVIMDVVYNHVSSASSSCFTKIMPKYYFRYDGNWNYYDGSGCNNEVKTDATMMRQYIVDSLCWWAKEYKIKGFRFDLMGLIDSWTLREAKNALFKIDPDIFIYGEGWTSGGYHGKYEKDGDVIINGGSETDVVYRSLYDNGTTDRGYVGAFNDAGRNALKGSNDDGYNQNPYPQWGFISQGKGDIGDKTNILADMLKGIHTGKGGNPSQTVNYASCHDNYTLWDQLRYCLAIGYNADHTPITAPNNADVIYASLAAHGAVMASNSAAFIQGGEELYRSKVYDPSDLPQLEEDGIVRYFPKYVHYSDDPDVIQATEDVMMYGEIVSHNSYKASDKVNSFKWNRKIKVGNTDTTSFNEVWQKMIKNHSVTSKYGYPSNCDPELGKMSTWGTTFDNGSCSGAIGMWNADTATNGGYYFFISARESTSIGVDLSNTEIAFCNRNPGSFADYKLQLEPYTIVCYRKKNA